MFRGLYLFRRAHTQAHARSRDTCCGEYRNAKRSILIEKGTAMKRTSHLFMLALVLIAPLQKQQVWTANIDQIRRVARMIPGRDPLRINVLKFAESRRAKKFSVKGAPDEPSVQARTAFQIVYADGTIMLDSGMDQQVHNFFGRGAVEPYDSDAARDVERALVAARSIIVTHEHGDHVAGVIHTPSAK